MPIFVLIAWALVFLAFVSGESGPREAAVHALMTITVAVLLLSEVLSVFHGLSFWPVAVFWCAATALIAVGLRGQIRLGIERIRAARRPVWNPFDLLVAAILGFFAIGTLLSAVLYPTTNYDSLTYHMPRVFFWFQNHSIGHYPTAEGRQLFSGPLVEYVVLQLKILAGGSDRLANLVQWFSYVFSVVVVSLVARCLGADRRGQQVAAVAAAALPMSVLQASTTQNDLTCALWSLVAVYWMLLFMTDSVGRHRPTLVYSLGIGGATALATHAKPTAYLFMAPFVVWSAVVSIRRAGWKRASALAGSAVAVFLILSAGWYLGNVRSLGDDILGLNAPGNTRVLIKERTAEAFSTNALKNASMMLATPSGAVNRAVASAVRATVRLYGGDVENARTKEFSDLTYELDGHVTSHDVGPYPLTVMLVAFSGLVLVAAGRRTHRFGLWYGACATIGLCAVAGLVTWNHYIDRVLLGSMLLAVPLVGAAASVLTSGARRSGRAILAGLLVMSVAWGMAAMLFNTTNRLVPPRLLPVFAGNRDLGYWNTSYDDLRFRILVPYLEGPMKTIASSIRQNGIERVGLSVRAENFPIFPLMALLPDRRFDYVGTVVLPTPGEPVASPQAIVEVVWADHYPAVLLEGTPRGVQLAEPQRAGDVVLLLYRSP